MRGARLFERGMIYVAPKVRFVKRRQEVGMALLAASPVHLVHERSRGRLIKSYDQTLLAALKA